jgi:UPF0176 protein
MQNSVKSEGFDIVSFYFFIPLDDGAIDSIRSACDSFVTSIGLRGLIILAPEGLNGTVACPAGFLDKFVAYLQSDISEGDWKLKFSTSVKPPFKRFSLKIREEIVTSGHPDLFPDPADPSHISVDEWHQLMQNEKEYFMIDVRNDYEVKLGTFKGAINPHTNDFREFPEFIESCNIPKDEPVYICCTGGIRCEKAYLEMKEKGFSKVYQLDGGILRYLEKYPDAHFNGECFVFDDRVALDQSLSPSEQYALCPHCGDPAKDIVSCANCGSERKICTECQKVPQRMTCSKNCAYHYALALKRGSKTDSVLLPSQKEPSSEACHSSESGRSGLISMVLLFAIVFFPAFIYSQGNPEDVAREAISKMQEKGDPSPVVNYVDWEHMFGTLPDENKKVMNVSSPDELKSFYHKVLESPSSEISDILSSKIASGELGGGADINESRAAEVISKLQQRLKEKEEQIKRKLKESEYRVEQESVTGDSAIINIHHTFESETTIDRVQMHKKDGQWFFTSLSNAFTGKQQ